MAACVVGFVSWFFSYTHTYRSALTPLAVQAMQSQAPAADLPQMRFKLATLRYESAYRTGLSTPTVWLRAEIPAGAPAQARVVHFGEKNVGKAELWLIDRQGQVVFNATAGAAVSQTNATRAFPGFAIHLPLELNELPLEAVLRIEPFGITKLRADLWRSDSFDDAQSKAQQRTTLLIGALIFLAIYALAAANSGRVTMFLVFGLWLAARCGLVMAESGFSNFAFGEFAGSAIGIKMRQFTYLAYPLTTVMLVRMLFHDDLADTWLAPALRRLQYLAGALMWLGLLMPLPVFQVSLWLIGGLVLCTLVCAIAKVARRRPDPATTWYLIGLGADALGSSGEILHAIGVLQTSVAWFRLEQVSLISALLTGMAVGTTIARERKRRIRSQLDALQALSKYQAVYRTVPIGLVSLTEHGGLARFNEGFARMFGLPSGSFGESAQQNSRETNALLDVAFPHALRNRIRTELSRASECDFEYEIDSDSRSRWLRVMARGSVRSHEASITDITEHKRLQSNLARAAELDPLTGALNRLGLTRRLDALISDGTDIERHAICYMDLDRFKMLNDMFGHHAGDTVLIDVVTRMRGVLTPSTAIARLGGDEFVLLLDAGDQASHEATAFKALTAITEMPFALDDRSFSVTASIGVFGLISGMTVPELIAGADRSCQEAKRKGRNQVVVCADAGALVKQRVSELSLLARLHDERAFAELELVGQPIVSLHAPSHYGIEVLLRHRLPDGTLDPAGQLIAAAEQNGEMARIDRWVLRRSLEWFSVHAGALDKIDFVSLNLSGSSLNDEFFKAYVVALLQKHRRIAKHLVLEITESVAMQDVYMMKRFIDAVRQAGARVAIDDFGSGYSNFASLTDIRASFLKIDGKFVQALAKRGNSDKIIRTITLLAHELQMLCIAEWVEDLAHLDMLKQIGVDYAQGHLLAAPVPLEQALQLIEQGPLPLSVDVFRVLDSIDTPAPSAETDLQSLDEHTL